MSPGTYFENMQMGNESCQAGRYHDASFWMAAVAAITAIGAIAISAATLAELKEMRKENKINQVIGLRNLSETSKLNNAPVQATEVEQVMGAETPMPTTDPSATMPGLEAIPVSTPQ